MLASRVLDKEAQMITSDNILNFITIDAGGQYLTLTFYQAKNQGVGKWEIKVNGFRVFANLGGRKIEEDLIAYLLINKIDMTDKFLKNPYIRESLGEKLRFETKLSEQYGKHYLSQISGKWKKALEEFIIETVEMESFKTPDQVIISGGVSRTRQFRHIVEDVFGVDKCLYLDPDTAIAEGAALYAAGMAPDITLKKEYHVGIGLESGKFFPMILNSEMLKKGSTSCLAFRFKPQVDKHSDYLKIWAYYGQSSENIGNIPLGFVSIDLKTRPLNTMSVNEEISFVVKLKVENIANQLFGSMDIYDMTLTNLYGSTKLEFPDEW